MEYMQLNGRILMEKKKVIIWGKGKEYLHFKNILFSDEILSNKNETRDEYIIAGVYDKNDTKSNISLEEMKIIHPEYIITSSFLLKEIENEVNIIGIAGTEVISFENFIDKRLVVHDKAVGNGRPLDKYIRLINERSKIKVENIFELGANYGQDAAYCRLAWNLSPNNVYLIEANPKIAQTISEMYEFNVFNVAVGDKNGQIELRLVPEDSDNSGISTIVDFDFTREWERVKVDSIRMDKFLEEHKDIRKISFAKIDVEGVNYETLVGFGTYLDRVQAIQIEGDNVARFEKHHLFFEMAELLYNSGFELIDYVLHEGNIQSDSLWIKKTELR